MTTTKLVHESQTRGKKMRFIEEPMLFQPIGIGMQQGEPAFTAKINEVLYKLDEDGEINRLWEKWLGEDTEYKIKREEKVVPLSELKFEAIQ